MNNENYSSLEELKKANLLLQNYKTQNSALQNENQELKDQLIWLKKQIFGKKSERLIDVKNSEQLTLIDFEIDQEEETKSIKAHTRKVSKKNKSEKIKIPEDLPVEEIILDIPEEEKICPETNKPLVEIGKEISLKLAHIPGRFYIKKFIRPKYANTHKPEDGIKIASMPDGIIPKCRVDESLLSDILVKKFADHLPLYRINEIFIRDKIYISRKLLSQWVVKIGLSLKPLYDEMQKKILESNNVFIDESPVNILDSPKVKQAYMWVLTGGKLQMPYYRCYNFKLDRKHNHAEELLKNYKGILHSDKYGAYEKLAQKKQFIWIPCFAHIRRKFFDAQTDLTYKDYFLRKIKYLYLFERIAWNRSEEERLKIRQEKQKPIIDELIESAKNQLHNGRILPKSKIGVALRYFYSLVPYMKNYLNHPFAHIDNNVAERAVRPIAIGRKNWLFFGSEDAGIAAGVIMSLVQTCRALNINPREYLEDILRRIMSHSNQKLEELLPDYWALNRNSIIQK